MIYIYICFFVYDNVRLCLFRTQGAATGLCSSQIPVASISCLSRAFWEFPKQNSVALIWHMVCFNMEYIICMVYGILEVPKRRGPGLDGSPCCWTHVTQPSTKELDYWTSCFTPQCGMTASKVARRSSSLFGRLLPSSLHISNKSPGIFSYRSSELRAIAHTIAASNCACTYLYA